MVGWLVSWLVGWLVDGWIGVGVGVGVGFAGLPVCPCPGLAVSLSLWEFCWLLDFESYLIINRRPYSALSRLSSIFAPGTAYGPANHPPPKKTHTTSLPRTPPFALPIACNTSRSRISRKSFVAVTTPLQKVSLFVGLVENRQIFQPKSLTCCGFSGKLNLISTKKCKSKDPLPNSSQASVSMSRSCTSSTMTQSHCCRHMSPTARRSSVPTWLWVKNRYPK